MTGPDALGWLRDAITGRLELARAGQPDTADPLTGEWTTYGHTPGPYDHRQDRDIQMVGAEGTDEAGWKVCEVGQWDRAPALAAHIAANDPRAIIADCEKDLAVLDEHATADYGYGPHCRTCFDVGDGIPQAVPCPCWTVRLIAAGYRHHPGWAEAGWTA